MAHRDPSISAASARRPGLSLAVLRFVGWLLVLLFALLFLGSAVMAVRSYWVADWLRWWPQSDPGKPQYDVIVWSARGGVGVFVTETSGLLGLSSGGTFYRKDASLQYPYVPEPDRKDGWCISGLGFTFFDKQGRRHSRLESGGQIVSTWYRQHDRAYIMPWWFVMLASAPVMVVGARRIFRRRGRGFEVRSAES